MKVKDSDELKLSISAFMEIGRERNKLVHQDYATFALEKTLDEVHGLYRNALLFVDSFPAFLRESAIEVIPTIAVSSTVQRQDPADGSKG